MFAVAYPYGEIEPFMTPRIEPYRPLTRRRPELPAWLDEALARAVAVKPGSALGRRDRIRARTGSRAQARAPPELTHKPLYERNPLMVWKLATFALGLLSLALLMRLAAR